MSRKMDHILAVLEIVQSEHKKSPRMPLGNLRKDAYRIIAKRHGVNYSTINSACARQLEPDISGGDMFDDEVGLWLKQGNRHLRDVLLVHAGGAQDKQNIENFFGRHEIKPDENLHQRMQRLTKTFEESTNDQSYFNPETIEDDRHIVARELVQRRGQHKFRSSLLEMYKGVCSVTSTSVVEVLEAAHITPFLGDESNHLTNGLLLRADIHTLFDHGLLAIDESKYTVLISNDVTDPQYRNLHGQKILLPENLDLWPSKSALKKHRLDAMLHVD